MPAARKALALGADWYGRPPGPPPARFVALETAATQAGRPAEEVRKYYEKEGLVDNLVDKLREEKTIEFLLKNAVITEKIT